jgi:hypothetical protein
MSLYIHVIMPALNEETFIRAQLEILYPHCAGISVVTQFDRDWYGNPVVPDKTANLVLEHPDPEGKIHLVVRRWVDQASALNCEMAALTSQPHRGVLPHSVSAGRLKAFHRKPDYFWIIDADEVYDPETIPGILAYLENERPAAMRVTGKNYLTSWNNRVIDPSVVFQQYGFVRAGIRFRSIREVSFNHGRLSKALRALGLPDVSGNVLGLRVCPTDIGHFHHGCWLGDEKRLWNKFVKSAHSWSNSNIHMKNVLNLQTERLAPENLPLAITRRQWPDGFLNS